MLFRRCTLDRFMQTLIELHRYAHGNNVYLNLIEIEGKLTSIFYNLYMRMYQDMPDSRISERFRSYKSVLCNYFA